MLNILGSSSGRRSDVGRLTYAAVLSAGAVTAIVGSSLVATAQANAPAEEIKTAARKSGAAAAAHKSMDYAVEETRTAHFKALDKAIAPLRAYGPSAADAERIRDAIHALRKQHPEKAAAIGAKITDPVGRKLVQWYSLRRGFGERAQDYKVFLDANPSWPSRTVLQRRFEEALFTEGGDSAKIKAYFASSEPETGAGLAALASAYLAEGNKAKAKSLAAKAWRESEISDDIEKGFLSRFGDLLTEADHKWRLDRLLNEDVRWSRQRKERAKVVNRLIPLLPAFEQKKAKARLAVFMRSKSAAKLIDALPAEKKPDWGLAYHRIQLLRRSDHEQEAAKLLLGAPTDPDVVAGLDGWWEERRALAYHALNNGNPKLAYALVREAGPLSVNPLKEQEFMAGWLALRFLKDVPAAERHFQAFHKAADGPLSRSKANYWMARTAQARGEGAKANKYYREATKDLDTFHGLLSLAALNPGKAKLELTPPAKPTKEQIARFNAMDAAKAVVLARKSRLDRAITRPFLYQLRTTLNTEAESGLVAHLAEAVGDTQTSLRVAKAAIARGQNLITYGYPVHGLPSYKTLRPPPEKAFLLGIARQETEFNSDIVSGAGARGILQVMPGTAKHVCRDYKIKCDIKRLHNDSAYNAMIASAYVGDRMEEFDGSYVLGIAGYNAGPGRARQWIRQFGDPRSPKVDPIDWIERIPFEETRAYVGKVLSNIQVYRSRLAGGTSRLRIMDDLRRARKGKDAPAEAESRSSAIANGG